MEKLISSFLFILFSLKISSGEVQPMISIKQVRKISPKWCAKGEKLPRKFKSQGCFCPKHFMTKMENRSKLFLYVLYL